MATGRTQPATATTTTTVAAPTALITGANRGIGLQVAKELVSRGWQVWLGVRDLAAGETAVNAIATSPFGQKGIGSTQVLPLDVSDPASIQSAAAQLQSQIAALTVLVNNAAIYPDEGVSILTISRQQMVSTFHTNVFGPLEVTQQFLPLLRNASLGRIINLSSGYGQLAGLSAQVPSYCLSKLAINGLTIMLAQALRGSNVVVNSVGPGWVRTDMGGPNATRSVEEGADTIVWLATEADAKLTGKFFTDRREISW